MNKKLYNKNAKLFNTGDSVEVNGENGVVEWVNLRNEYCINTNSGKDIYVYRDGKFILLKDIVSNKRYLKVYITPKQDKYKKYKNIHKKSSKKNNKKAISKYYIEKIYGHNKQLINKKMLEAKVEAYFTQQKQPEDLFALLNRLPGSYGSRQ